MDAAKGVMLSAHISASDTKVLFSPGSACGNRTLSFKLNFIILPDVGDFKSANPLSVVYLPRLGLYIVYKSIAKYLVVSGLFNDKHT